MSPATTLLDRTYLLHERLGQGGMGAVYRAEHRMSGRLVAVKQLRGDAAEQSRSSHSSLTPGLALAREFQILSSLHHPNIVQVLDYGFDEALGPFVAMELLSPAETILEAAAARSTRDSVTLLAQLLLALAYLHRRRIIHRDLKPSNVLCRGGTVKVLDFGLATPALQATGLAGTLDYVAPELWLGAAPSVASDLYACGVIACQMLTGHVPDWEQRELLQDLSRTSNTTWFGSDATVSTLLATIRRRQESTRLSADRFDQPPPPSPVLTIDGPVGAVVRRLLEKDPSRRYPNAVAVLADLSDALGEPLPVETVETRESFLQASEMIGRDRELATLRGALKTTFEGHGSGWLIGGESGVGKSRLVSELRTHALVEGAAVAQGQAVAEGGSAYQVWLPILATLCLRIELSVAQASTLQALVPGVRRLFDGPLPAPPPLPPAAAQSRLLGTIESIVRQQDRPVLVLLEDLQWADEDSRALLDRLHAISADSRVMIVATYRDDEAAWLPERLPRMTRLPLARLDRAHCARLSTSMLGTVSLAPVLVDYLFRETEGNVFFLVEILRELAERAGRLERIADVELPDHVFTRGIDRLATRRFSRISDEQRQLLSLAAVAGREIDLEVMTKAAGGADLSGWLLASAEAAVLERQQGTWRFVHDKLREAILLHIDPGELAGLHRRIAQAAEALYDAATLDARSAALAHHLEQAGDLRKAWIFRMRAGDRATRLCAYAEARQHYATALALVNRLEDSDETRRRKIDTLLKQVYTRLLADTGDENLRAMTEATALLDGMSSRAPLGTADELRLARVKHAVGRIHFYRGDVQAAIASFTQVLPLAQKSGDEELMALPSLLIGTVYLAKGNVRDAEPLLARAIGPMDRLGEPFEWFRAVGYHGASLIGLGRCHEGMSELERILVRARQIGQPSLLAASHLMRGSSFLISGAWPLVIDELTETVRLAHNTGERLLLTMAWLGLAWAQSFLGRHDDAEASRAKGRELASPIGGNFLLGDWYDAGEAEIAWNADRSDDALARAQAVVARSSAAGLLFSLGIAERVIGAVLADRGLAEADAHLSASIAAFEQGGMVLPAARTHLEWALLHRRRGSADSASRLFARARERFERAGCAYALADADRRWAGPDAAPV